VDSSGSSSQSVEQQLQQHYQYCSHYKQQQQQYYQCQQQQQQQRMETAPPGEVELPLKAGSTCAVGFVPPQPLSRHLHAQCYEALIRADQQLKRNQLVLSFQQNLTEFDAVNSAVLSTLPALQQQQVSKQQAAQQRTAKQQRSAPLSCAKESLDKLLAARAKLQHTLATSTFAADKEELLQQRTAQAQAQTQDKALSELIDNMRATLARENLAHVDLAKVLVYIVTKASLPQQ
jgi:hypothetical protein